MTRAVSVGIHVPSVSVGPLPAADTYTAFFGEAERVGFDALWVEDRIFHPAHVLDPLLLLTWAAASTRRIDLGTAVALLNLRRAPLLARQVSTLRHLAGARMAIGVSIGGQPEEYRALGLPMDRRVTLFREGVTALRELLQGGPVDRQSELMRLDGAIVRPAAPVPIYVGGRVEAALRRAGELADGWIMGPFGGLDAFAPAWRAVREGARRAGRDPDALVAGRLVYVAVDDDRDRARETLSTFLHGYYGPLFDVDRDALFGRAADVAARLREHVDAGIGMLMLGVPTLDLAHLRQVAEQVLPPLRA